MAATRTRPAAALEALRVNRTPDMSRKVWAGLHVSAEWLGGGLDTGPEEVAMTSGRGAVIKGLGLARSRVGRPATVDVWTWTLSRRAIDRLATWRREGDTVRLAVDASLWRRQPAYGRLVVERLGASLRAASLHAKAAAVTGPRGSVFVAGSRNLNLCRRAELVWLSTDPALVAWLRGLTDRLFAAVPAGAPREADDALHDRMCRAFPGTAARPTWADGVPVLRG